MYTLLHMFALWTSLADAPMNVGIMFGVPMFLLGTIVILSLPGLLRSTTHPKNVVRAAFSCMAASLGVGLMSLSGIPALQSVLTQSSLSNGAYLGLLLVFACGGFLYLWHDGKLMHIPEADKEGPYALYLMGWKGIGLMTFIFALLSFVLQILLGGMPETGMWTSHVSLMVYGLILLWSTADPNPNRMERKVVAINPVLKPALLSSGKKRSVKRKRK